MAIRESYYKEGDGFLCVYGNLPSKHSLAVRAIMNLLWPSDITSRTTFNDVEDFHDAILRVKDANSVPFMLVGNKADMEEKRVVQRSELEEKAKKLGCKFMETSAKSRQNVDEIFTYVFTSVCPWLLASHAPFFCSELVKETIAFRAARNPRNNAPNAATAPNKDNGKDKKKKNCILI